MRTAIVKNSISGFCAAAAEAASDLWDVHWSSDTRDLKVKRGKEHLSALEGSKEVTAVPELLMVFKMLSTADRGKKKGPFHIR